jgi:hypothetical protein
MITGVLSLADYIFFSVFHIIDYSAFMVPESDAIIIIVCGVWPCALLVFTSMLLCIGNRKKIFWLYYPYICLSVSWALMI